MNAPSIRALLEKPRRVGSPLAESLPQAEEQGEEYEPFARGLIGNKPQLTLVFRKANGAVRGFSYSYYYGIESNDPARGFTVDFTHDKAEVIGRGLERLFRLVCEHRAVEIVEATRSQVLEAVDGAAVVEDIRISSP